MVDVRVAVVLAVHGAVAAFFFGIGVLGALDGDPLPAAGLRIVMGVLVAGLGVVVARIVRRR